MNLTVHLPSDRFRSLHLSEQSSEARGTEIAMMKTKA